MGFDAFVPIPVFNLFQRAPSIVSWMVQIVRQSSMTERVSNSSGLPLGVEPSAVLRQDCGYGVSLGGVNVLSQHLPSLRPHPPARSGRSGD